MPNRLIQIFMLSAGGILLLAALGRFVTLAESPWLPLRDPLTEAPMPYLVLAAGLIELIVALVCLFGRNLGLQSALLAWAAIICLAYQTMLFSAGYPLNYGCLGSFADPLHWSRGVIGWVADVASAYVLAGSVIAFAWAWFTRAGKAAQRIAMQSIDERDAAAGLLKMTCPKCGGHIKFAAQNTGQNIPCPHCQAAITLRGPQLLKTACFFCHGHIEFPAHAIGRKMPCPHCNMDITLREPSPL